MTMLEKAARALHENSDSPVDWDDLSDDAEGYWMDQARAVIESLREPSEEMMMAGAGAIDDGETPGVRTAAELCWTAMLDAILKEGT